MALKTRYNWQNKLIVESERNDGNHHFSNGEIVIALWYDLGFFQFGGEGKQWTDARRLMVGDKASVQIGDYSFTIERVSMNDKIRKLRK